MHNAHAHIFIIDQYGAEAEKKLEFFQKKILGLQWFEATKQWNRYIFDVNLCIQTR